MQQRWRKTARLIPQATLIYGLLALLVVIMLGPYLYIFASSFKETYTLISIPPTLLPEKFVWDNYTYILQELPFLTWFTNTVFVAIAVTVGTLLVDALAAYAFAKKQFWGRDFLFGIMLATIMIPGALLLIPTFLITNWFGLLDSYGGLIIPALANVLGVFLLRQFIQTLPEDLEAAARIDGGSEFGVFWRIILPLSKPALAAVAVFAFIGNWNNFLMPLVYLQDEEKYTLALALQHVQGEYGVYLYHYMMAVAVVTVIPVIVIFFLAQRYSIRGVVMSGIKG